MSCETKPHSGGLWGVAVSAFVLAWGLLCSPWLVGGLTIPYDAKAHFQAQLQFLANAIHSGQSPFWTPNVFGGSPQIADPQSLIFSPAILIAYFNPAPSFTTVDAYVFVHLGLAGLAIMMLFRDRGWHPAGGLVAALGFAFGASAAWRVQHIGQIQSFAMFGITLWLLARALDRPTIWRGSLAGLAAGLMVVEPDQVALLACYVLAGFVVADIVAAPKWMQRSLSLTPALLAASVIGALIVAVPLLLTYLFVEASSRADIPFATAAHGSLHPASLLTAVVGDLFGALDPLVPYWGPYSYAWDHFDQTLTQNMGQIYTGALPVLLLLTIGLVRGAAWRPDIRFFTLALLAMTIYAVGAFTPIFHVVYDYVPGIHLFRRPADATFLMGGLLSIVGGYLVHTLMTGAVPPASQRMRWLEQLGLAAIFASCCAIAVQQGHLADAVKPLIVAAVFMSSAKAACLWLPRLEARRASLGVLAAGAFMTADLAINNGPNESTALPLAGYDILKPDSTNETIRFLKARLTPAPHSPRRDRVELVGLGFEWPNVSLIHGFEQILGYNPLRLETATEGMGAGETSASWDQRHFSPLFPSYRSLLADMLGLRYIASGVPIERIDKNLKPGDLKFVRRTKDAFIYENPHALPRMMVVNNWMRADFEQLTKTGVWPAFDPAQTLLLESPPPHATSPIMPVVLRQPARVSIERYENTVIDVDVTTAQTSFVLRNCMWHPWWRATVDGEPAEVLKANVMFQAVQVPPGHHRVEFTFNPIEGAWDQLNPAPHAAAPPVQIAHRPAT